MKIYYNPTPHQCRHLAFFNIAPIIKMEGRYVDLIDLMHARWHPREPWSPAGRSTAWGFKRWHEARRRKRMSFGYQDEMKDAAPGLHEKLREKRHDRRAAAEHG